MSEIVILDDIRAHSSITGRSGNIHVIPDIVMNKIITGVMDISDIEEHRDIVPTIVKEWRDMILRGCNDPSRHE